MTEALTGPVLSKYVYAIRSVRLGRLRLSLLSGWPFVSFRIERECNSILFARAELARIRNPDGKPDEMQAAIERHILKMVRTFSEEGHSGSSAGYTIGILQKLLRFEPLTPLTGDADEWNEISDMADEPLWQNRRCSHVFKGPDGAYDSSGRVFTGPDGWSFTNRDSRVPVTFPYVPSIEYVTVDEHGQPVGATP